MAEESRALQAKNEAGWDLHGLRTASQRTAKSKHQVVSNQSRRANSCGGVRITSCPITMMSDILHALLLRCRSSLFFSWEAFLQHRTECEWFVINDDNDYALYYIPFSAGRWRQNKKAMYLPFLFWLNKRSTGLWWWVLCGVIMRLLMGLNKLGFANACLEQERWVYFFFIFLWRFYLLLSHYSFSTSSKLRCTRGLVDNEGVERQPVPLYQRKKLRRRVVVVVKFCYYTTTLWAPLLRI